MIAIDKNELLGKGENIIQFYLEHGFKKLLLEIFDEIIDNLFKKRGL